MEQAQLAELAVEWRGNERYEVTWRRQLELHAKRKAGEAPDTLILVEHEPVITLGRQGSPANLLVSQPWLASNGIDFHRIERGGDITFHGPGQLVGYPILSLPARGMSVHGLVASLETALIQLAASHGVQARTEPGLTGVWAQSDRGLDKLAAIGIAVKNGVSFHGFALNVNTDLSQFKQIVPCGITDHGVCSLQSLLGRTLPLQPLAGQIAAVLRGCLIGRPD